MYSATLIDIAADKGSSGMLYSRRSSLAQNHAPASAGASWIPDLLIANANLSNATYTDNSGVYPRSLCFNYIIHR